MVAQTVKRLPPMRETWVPSLGWEDPLEKEMATHSSTLAWKIPWEEPGKLQSMGSQKSQTRPSDFTFTFLLWCGRVGRVSIALEAENARYLAWLCAQLLSHVRHFCDPMDCSLPGSSVHGILQAKILEWVAISFSRGSSQPRDQTHVSCVSGIGWQILFFFF